jgi:hypothetical protein
LFCLFGEMWLWFHSCAVLFYVSNCDVYCSPDVVKSLRIVMLCSTCASLVFRDYVGYTFTLYVECFNIIWNIDVFLVLTNMLQTLQSGETSQHLENNKHRNFIHKTTLRMHEIIITFLRINQTTPSEHNIIIQIDKPRDKPVAWEASVRYIF